MDNINLFYVATAAGLLLACTNPAPYAASASNQPALDRVAQGQAHGNTPCEVAQRPAQALPAQSRGLFERASAAVDGADSRTRDYAKAASHCADSLAGSYAIEVELDVYAQDDPSIVSGQYDPLRDRATLLLRADIEQAQGDVSDATLRLCGLALPARYAYATSTATQLIVPNEVWARESMPEFRSQLHATSQQLQLDAFPVLLGIALTEPGMTWPSYNDTPDVECGSGRRGSSCFPDHDADGEPGLTLEARANAGVVDAPYPACSTWSYSAPSTQPEPWLAAGGESAQRSFVGLRTAMQLSLDLDESCTQGTGSVIAEDILTRTFDCELTFGQRCTPYQATVADARAPSFHVLGKREIPAPSFHDSRDFIDEALDRVPSDGGHVTIRRLETASCSAVRAAFGR